MQPGLTSVNTRDSHRRHAKHQGYPSLRNLPKHFSYFSNLFVGQFMVFVFLAFVGVKTLIPCMFFVVFRGNPFEILRTVVQSIGVYMVDLSQVVLIRQKSFGYQSVYQKLLILFWNPIKRHALVSSSDKPRPQVLISTVRKNIAALASRVQTLKPLNVAHDPIIPTVLLYATRRLKIIV